MWQGKSFGSRKFNIANLREPMASDSILRDAVAIEVLTHPSGRENARCGGVLENAPFRGPIGTQGTKSASLQVRD